MARNARTVAPAPRCNPVGNFPMIYLDAYACDCGHRYRCACGTAVRHVATPDGYDWSWLDADGQGIVSTAPEGFDSWYTFRDHLAEVAAREGDTPLGNRAIEAYSTLSASLSLSGPRFHRHHAASHTHAPRADDLPWCCGWPMHHAPRGWVCRQGRTIVPFDLAAAPAAT